MTTSAKRCLRLGFAAFVLALAVLWPARAGSQDKPEPREKPAAEARSLRREMARDLFNVTPEQEKKLLELREAGRRDRQAYRDERTRMRAEMRELMKDSQANAAKIDKVIDSRARLQADWEKKAFRSRNEWRKVFTPEQLQKIDKYRGLFRERFAAGEGWHWGMRPGARARRWRVPYDPWL